MMDKTNRMVLGGKRKRERQFREKSEKKRAEKRSKNVPESPSEETREETKTKRNREEVSEWREKELVGTDTQYYVEAILNAEFVHVTARTLFIHLLSFFSFSQPVRSELKLEESTFHSFSHIDIHLHIATEQTKHKILL